MCVCAYLLYVIQYNWIILWASPLQNGNSFFRIGIFNVDVITVIGYAIQDGFSLCVLSAEHMKPTLFENL